MIEEYSLEKLSEVFAGHSEEVGKRDGEELFNLPKALKRIVDELIDIKQRLDGE